MTTTIRKAVFPAAGLGTRFLPATKAQPKEMLPLVDKPIIQYGVEEAVASGISNIILVTGRGKNAIEDHFDVSVELETFLEARGKRDLLEEIDAPVHEGDHGVARAGPPVAEGLGPLVAGEAQRLALVHEHDAAHVAPDRQVPGRRDSGRAGPADDDLGGGSAHLEDPRPPRPGGF